MHLLLMTSWAQEGLFQFPTVIGGVVLAINLPGVKSGELVLDGKTLGDIYLGKIKKWDDAAIAKLNPGMKLPSQNIAVVRRAMRSGTSFVFTSYLAKVNEEWKSKIGAGSTVNWPTGLGGKGNDGIAAFVQRSAGLYRLRRICLRKNRTTSLTPNCCPPMASR
ncbi:phosphate ABC transporter [Klebsiella michiganensis]|uniref:Phosphate ABC transporter n=1 Tax=Klebsiella michiganensis TaxID=1134687 RepID=A0A7H4PET7_9ENTR|nr:phosphate ABC transporter [Klebsiella michiganensis]